MGGITAIDAGTRSTPRKFKSPWTATRPRPPWRYRLSDVIAIYPITPSSTMGEWADQWAAAHQRRSPGHGAHGDRDAERRRGGRCACTGPPDGSARHHLHGVPGLLLVIPNMYKIAGELTPHRLPRGRALPRHSGPVHLRRPQRRDGRARHRLRHARVELGAGGHGHGAGGSRLDPRGAAARSCTSSTAFARPTR